MQWEVDFLGFLLYMSLVMKFHVVLHIFTSFCGDHLMFYSYFSRTIELYMLYIKIREELVILRFWLFLFTFWMLAPFMFWL